MFFAVKIDPPEISVSPGTQVTLRDALRLPALRRARPEVVAAAARLDQAIRWAHAGEVANIADLLQGGELLLTTGLGLGRTPAAQRRFVRELSRRNVAGVVLELGKTHRVAPAALVAAADKSSLPIVVLHREARFVEITEELHRLIIGRQLELLRRGESLHERFTTLLLEGAGVSEVLAALAQLVANPVLLVRAGEVISHATYRTGDADVLSAWASPPARALRLPVPAAAGSTRGELVVLPLDSPLDDGSRVAAERAVAVLAVVLLRRHEEERLVIGEHGSFLAALAADEIDPADAQLRADLLHFEHDGWLLPLALAPAAGRPTGASAWTTLCRALHQELAAQRMRVLVGTDEAIRDGARALAIAGLPGPDRRVDAAERIAAAVRTVAGRHLGASGGAIVAVGPAIRGWDEAAEALRETTAATALARGEPRRPWHDAAVPELDTLLWRLREDRALRSFADRRLAGLREHDAARPAAALLPTLEALCANGWSRTEAARALHVERQSIYNRIERLRALLGVDLDAPSTRAALHVAVLAAGWDDDGRP